MKMDLDLAPSKLDLEAVPPKIDLKPGPVTGGPGT